MKYTIEFGDEVKRRFDGLVVRTKSKDLAEVVGKALALYEHVQNEMDFGAKFVMELANGTRTVVTVQ